MNYIYKQRENGSVALVIVLAILAATATMALGAGLVGSLDIKLSGNYRDTTASFFAAEGGAHNAISELKNNIDWNAGFSDVSLNNGASYDVTYTQISQFRARINSVGRYNNSEREVEVLINTDEPFAHLINAGQDMTIRGIPFADNEGFRANGHVSLELPPVNLGIRPTLNIHSPDPDNLISTTGDDQNITTEFIPEMDTKALKLAMPEWEEIASAADPSYYFDNDGEFNTKDTNLGPNDLANETFYLLGFIPIPEFNCNRLPADADGKRTLFVDGNVNLDGLVLTGNDCTIVATGDITGGGGNFNESVRAPLLSETEMSLIAMGDIDIDFDTIIHNQMRGLFYAEGDMQISGKFVFEGVMTALGNVNVIGQTDWLSFLWRLYIHQYTSAYNVLFDPVNIISWREIHPDFG